MKPNSYRSIECFIVYGDNFIDSGWIFKAGMSASKAGMSASTIVTVTLHGREVDLPV